jgi:hypothetical protein
VNFITYLEPPYLLNYNYIVVPLPTGFFVSAYLNGEGVQEFLTPHPRVPTRPSTFEMLRIREHAPTPSPSTIFIFRLVVESIKELGGVSSVIPKVGVHLKVIGLHPLHSPPFVKVCFTPKHSLLALWALAFHT